ELKVLWMLYGIAGNSGNYRKELAYAEMYDATARASMDVMAEFRRHRMLGRSLGDLGRLALAREHLELALRTNRASMPRLALNAYELTIGSPPERPSRESYGCKGSRMTPKKKLINALRKRCKS